MSDETITAGEVNEAPNETPRSTSTALAVIRSALPTILAADEKDILGALKAELDAFSADPTTPTGREAIASMAYKVSRTKMDLDRLGKSLTEEWRKQTNAVNDERRVIERHMNALRDEVRAPLTAFETREKERVAAHQEALQEVESWATIPDDWTAYQVASRIEELRDSELLSRDWQEFHERAATAFRAAYNALRLAHLEREKAEAQAAEEARLAAEEAERHRIAEEEARKIREEQIAREAAEAARKAAEEEAARKAAEAEAAAQREREAAAERQRAAERREQAAREAAERAEREKAEAQARAEEQRVATHRMHIDNLRAYPRGLSADASSDMLRQMLASLARALRARDWQEYADEAATAATESEVSLKSELQRAEQREADAAEARRKGAEQRAREAAERAREEERKRQADEAAMRAADEKRRAENLEHRRRINKEAAAALADVIADAPTGYADEDIARDVAQAIVTAIARGTVPHTSIRY